MATAAEAPLRARGPVEPAGRNTPQRCDRGSRRTTPCDEPADCVEPRELHRGDRVRRPRPLRRHADRVPPAMSDPGRPQLRAVPSLLPSIPRREGDLHQDRSSTTLVDSEPTRKARRPPGSTAPGGGKASGRGRDFYQVFTGEGTIFPGKDPFGIRDVDDGTSNTLPWSRRARRCASTKPVEPPAYASDKPLRTRPDHRRRPLDLHRWRTEASTWRGTSSISRSPVVHPAEHGNVADSATSSRTIRQWLAISRRDPQQHLPPFRSGRVADALHPLEGIHGPRRGDHAFVHQTANLRRPVGR